MMDRFRALEVQLQKQEHTLAELLREAKRTNGRVKGHDKQIEDLGERISCEKEKRRVGKLERRRRLEVAIATVSVLVGGGLGELLHALGV